MARAHHLIDLNGVSELAGIDESDDRLLLRLVGHSATCTRGTLGGSLCDMDPAAALWGVAALHYTVLPGARGEREIGVAEPAGPRFARAEERLLCWASTRVIGMAAFILSRPAEDRSWLPVTALPSS